MKNTMKKLIVLMMVLILVMPQTLVMAGETGDTTSSMPSAMTITEELTIDEEAVKNLLPVFGLAGSQAKLIESAISVLNALSGKLVVADNGAQLDFDLKGQNIISIGGELTEDGFAAASTLFPNYVVTASMETIMGFLQTMSSGGGDNGDGTAGGLSMDMTAVSEKNSAYINEFIMACSQAAVPGEPEEAEFAYEGVTFNTKIPVELDVDAIVAAEKKLVEQILTDDDIRPLLDMSAQYSGGNFDPDSIREMSDEIFSEEHMPDVEASVYVNRDEEGNESDIFCAVSEATYKGEEEPSYRYTFLSEGTYGDMKLEIPEARTNIGCYYGTEESGMNIHLDYEMNGQYFGFTADVVYGADIIVTLDLFFNDPQNPLIRNVITVSMNGERTLKMDTEGKTILTLEEILEGGMEALSGLISDIMTNGLSNLVITATKAIPEAGGLISALMGSAFGDSGEQNTAEQQENQAARVLQLGSSVYTIEIPDSFEEGERTEEDIRDDMVAYLHSPDTLLDFDVYQFSKEGYPEVLADFTEQEAGEYNASEIVTDGNINGIDAAWYRAEETYDGQEYETLTYVLDGGDEYVEIVFWLDGDSAQAEADQIISSLTFVTR